MIQIGFSTTNLFLSRLIRKVTRAKVSHCWFLFDAYGKKFILQADVGGVKITPFDKISKKWVIIDTVKPQYPIDLAPAWDLLDQHYDYGGLIGSIWVYLGRWFKKKWGNPLQDADALFCSELITKVLQQQNYPGSDSLEPSTCSPEDLLEFLK